MAIAERFVSTRSAQLTNTLLMVSPDSFGFNPETATTNSFQNNLPESDLRVRNLAKIEFADMVNAIRNHGITVLTTPSRDDVITPDAVFPNNWVSFHNELEGFDAVLYPMLAPNRRAERQWEIINRLLTPARNRQSKVLDLTQLEQSGQFLEGTGSLVFDRIHKVVFAEESPRTNLQALDSFCLKTGYEPVTFHAYDHEGKMIYHTNVVISIGAGFSVVCLDAIIDHRERKTVESKLDQLELEIIEISRDQLGNFCGNTLEVKSKADDPVMIMSKRAFRSFEQKQMEKLQYFASILPVEIPTIEAIGGGSARCMLAEVFLK